MGRRKLVGGLVLFAALTTAAPAAAQTAPCRGKALKGAECGTVTVPLDHSGQTPGELPIAFARYGASGGTAQGTVVFLAGGPGEPSIAAARTLMRGPFRRVRRAYDVVFVDQRGTGRSAPLSCSAAPRGRLRITGSPLSERFMAAVRACGEELGDRRRFFTTYETVLDLEDVRRGLGLEQIVPVGVSYGGQVAGEYARRFPEHVQAMVLDSTSPLEGLDALARLPRLALRRVLRELCFPPGCDKLGGDPVLQLSAALSWLDGGPRAGVVVRPSGKEVRARMSASVLYELVTASDADPLARAELPAVIHALARRDATPALRTVARLNGGSGGGVNEVRFLATTCSEAVLPWDPAAPAGDRPARLGDALAAAPDAYAPFPAAAALPHLPATLCLGWPETPRPPAPPSSDAGPGAPVLLLAGREDLRTPLENQREAAEPYPNARVVAVPHTGHATLTSDLSGCAQRTLERFLAGTEVRRCVRRARVIEPAFPFVRDLAAVPPALGALALGRETRRTLTAVDLTLRDVDRQLTGVAAGGSTAASARAGVVRIGGMRGGRLEIGRDDVVRLVGYELVEGVRVSGRLTGRRGAVRVTGAGADGVLRLTRKGLAGTLGGEAVTYRPLAVTG